MPRPGEDRSDVGGAAQFNNIGPVPLSAFPLSPVHRKGGTDIAETLTVDRCPLPNSIGGSAKMLIKVLDTTVDSVKAWIDEDKAADGMNIVRNLESEEMLDLLATKRAESKLPTLQELQRFADANRPPKSWYDEDF